MDADDRELWRTWILTVTLGEAAGFVAPALAGVASADRPGLAFWLLPAAGAVEGAVLGAAQARVLRQVLPRLDARRWTLLTAGAAVAAYVLGAVIGRLVVAEPTWLGRPAAALAALLLLASLGGAQWLELRHHVRRAWTWVPWTGAAWLVALLVFLAVATPLWHEGQAAVLAVVVGVGAGLAMAWVQAAVTGRAILVLRRRPQRHRRVTSGPARGRPASPGRRAAARVR